MITEHIIIIIESAVILALAAALAAVCIKFCRKPATKAEDVKIVGGVRYTKDGEIENPDGSTNISHRVGDIILERGETYTVAKGGKIIPGKYTLLADSEGTKAFNLRVDGFVREYKHASDIVLSDGETVCAVSHSVILR